MCRGEVLVETFQELSAVSVAIRIRRPPAPSSLRNAEAVKAPVGRAAGKLVRPVSLQLPRGLGRPWVSLEGGTGRVPFISLWLVGLSFGQPPSVSLASGQQR